MAKKLWAPKLGLDACIRCHRRKYRHGGKGLCEMCVQSLAHIRARQRKAAAAASAGKE